MNQTQKEPIDVAAVLRKVIADNWGQPKGVTVPALDEAREALAFLESQPAPHEDTALLDWLEKEPMENLAAIKYGFQWGKAPTVRATIREHMKLECDSSQD